MITLGYATSLTQGYYYHAHFGASNGLLFIFVKSKNITVLGLDLSFEFNHISILKSCKS